MHVSPGLRRLGLAVALCLGWLLTSAPSDAGGSEPLDVQSFWRSPSELAALAVIREAFRERGGVWADFPVENFEQNRRLAFQRIIEGIPPFALQWHAGYELRAMSGSGSILDLTSIAEEMNWSAFMDPSVLDYLGDDGAAFSVPVGIHAENWAWFNAPLLHRYADSVPDTWDDVIAVLERAAADNVPGIAMGTHAWQRRILFSHILVGEGGAGLLRDLLGTGTPSLLYRSAFQRALSIYASLRAYDIRDPETQSWEDGIRAVARGDALVQFMGDWARAELALIGLEPGRDFECALSIGPEKHHFSVIDTFVFPRSDYGGLTNRHRIFAEAVLDPKTQIAFSEAKWAIPVRTDLGSQIEDPCVRKGYELYLTVNGSIPSSTMIAQERSIAALEEALSDFWDDRTATIDDGLEALRAVLRAGTIVNPAVGQGLE